jgi:hypothetical protein
MAFSQVTVRYVDGTQVTCALDRWTDLRAAGVDYVDLQSADGVYRVQGRSIYWLYQDGDRWVLGGGIVGNSEPIEEVIATAIGFEIRHPEYMPDLEHDRVKLGWWD